MSSYVDGPCYCPTCKTEHVDMYDEHQRLRTIRRAGKELIVQECDRCLEARASPQWTFWYQSLKETVRAAKAEEAAKAKVDRKGRGRK